MCFRCLSPPNELSSSHAAHSGCRGPFLIDPSAHGRWSERKGQTNRDGYEVEAFTRQRPEGGGEEDDGENCNGEGEMLRILTLWKVIGWLAVADEGMSTVRMVYVYLALLLCTTIGSCWAWKPMWAKSFVVAMEVVCI